MQKKAASCEQKITHFLYATELFIITYIHGNVTMSHTSSQRSIGNSDV